MAALAYYEEDLFEGSEVTDVQIKECTDAAQLHDWLVSVDAIVADIHGQVEVRALGGSVDPAWLHRCGKSSGFFRRAGSRIRSRMNALGIQTPDTTGKIGELQRKLAEAKLRNEIAAEFLRLAHEGAMPRHEFERLEAEAVKLVEARKSKRVAG